MNAVHGTPPFFTGTTASTLTVNVSVSTLQSGTSGTARRQLDRDAPSAPCATGAVDRQLRALVRKVASDARTRRTPGLTTQSSIVTTLDERRRRVSGVSLDEEMTNMIRFQRGYQASSRAMSTIDEMLDTLINRTGRVGL